jgi:hypothetical protein
LFELQESRAPLRVDVQDCSGTVKKPVTPVWIDNIVSAALKTGCVLCLSIVLTVNATQDVGIYRVSYVVPTTATTLSVKPYFNGKPIGTPPYIVHCVRTLECMRECLSCSNVHVFMQTVAMPLDVVTTLGDLTQTMPLFLNPRDVAIAPNMAFMCVSDVDYHQVMVSCV